MCAESQELWPMSSPASISRHGGSGWDDIRRSPGTSLDPQRPTAALTIPTTFPTMFLTAVTHPAGTDAATIPAVFPMAVSRAAPKRAGHRPRRKIADAIAVVMDFGVADVATGNTNVKRNMSVSTRHGGPPRDQRPGPQSLDEGRTGAIA